MSDVACSTTSQGGNPDDFPFFSQIQDWGGASFAPVSFTLAGSWIGAEPGFLLEHEQKLFLGGKNRRGFYESESYIELWGQYFIIKFYMSIIVHSKLG